MLSACALKVSFLNSTRCLGFSPTTMLGWLLNCPKIIFYLDYLILFLEPFFEKFLLDSSITRWFDFSILLNSSVPPIGLSLRSSSTKFLMELFLFLKMFYILLVWDYMWLGMIWLWLVNCYYCSVISSASSMTFFMTW